MYNLFAEHYDRFTRDVSYQQMGSYINSMVERYTAEKGILLDLACGTGSLTVELGQYGYDLLGIDSSYDMLSVAREKAQEAGYEITFVCQQMENLDLYGTIDVCVCSLDSLNHITDPKILKRALKRISLFLHPEGVFIFDVNTLYKHQQVLGNNCFIYEEDGVYCGWQNSTDDKHLTTIRLDFFVPEKEGYFRQIEEFSEQGYAIEELIQWLSEAGLQVEGCYDGYSATPVQGDSERAVFVVRKKHENKID